MAEEEEGTNSTHVAILASPGMGHLIPLAELAKRLLLLRPRFTVTLITQSTARFSHAEQAVLRSLPPCPGLTLIALPPPPDALIPTDAGDLAVIFFTIDHNFPAALRAVLQPLAPTALVVDLLMLGAFDLAAELAIPAYLFYTTNFMALSFCFHLPALDAAYGGAFADLGEPLQLPGCPPLRGSDFMYGLHERGSRMYDSVLRSVKRFGEARAILVNSFAELEPGTAEALRADPRVPPIYPVGPLVRACPTEPGGGGERLMKWLDAQPRGSVLYVSFGSVGPGLAPQQMRELAPGLELSGHRFLWAAKRLESLPEGFAERAEAEGTGLVVDSWVPQAAVLRHVATGGFLTHCGWNSVLESIAGAVPLIAWPLHAEQAMNAVLLAEGVKVAVRPAAGDGGLVGRTEIARAIRCLMDGGEEGRGFRRRMERVSAAAAGASDDGGSSTMALKQIAVEWKSLQEKKTT